MSSPLNPAQREAVRYLDGPLLVLAGAGSGKTRVITAKIAHLLAHGHDPGRIAAITFTNKAAREMRARATGLLAADGKGDLAADVTICTFHALGLKIIRGAAAALGLKPGFSILDPGDIEPIVAELMQTTDRARARAAQWRISAWKNALQSPAAAAKAARNDDEGAAVEAYRRYDDTLRAYQAVDFDDLIALPIGLLAADGTAAAKWRERCGYLLVDEYQDTNPAQYRLIRLLVGERAAFTVVGDDDQSIYGWRGASLDNLGELPKDYPAVKVIKLEQNYRSTVRILRSANALIANNPKLFDKKLWSEHGHGDPIRVSPAPTTRPKPKAWSGASWRTGSSIAVATSDYAILYRGNHQAKLFEQQLRAQGVPYEISGGQSYFERVEIKDIVALPPPHRQRRRRSCLHPRRDHAEARRRRNDAGKTLRRRRRAAREPVRRGVRRRSAPAVPARQREILESFCALINGLRHRAEREPAARLLDELVAAIGYEDFLLSTCERKQAQTRWQSVRDFVAWLSAKGEADRKNLLELTQLIALITMLEGRGRRARRTR